MFTSPLEPLYNDDDEEYNILAAADLIAGATGDWDALVARAQAEMAAAHADL